MYCRIRTDINMNKLLTCTFSLIKSLMSEYSDKYTLKIGLETLDFHGFFKDRVEMGLARLRALTLVIQPEPIFIGCSRNGISPAQGIDTRCFFWLRFRGFL